MSARHLIINISVAATVDFRLSFALCEYTSLHEKFWCAINYSVSTKLFKLSFFRDTELFILQLFLRRLKRKFPRAFVCSSGHEMKGRKWNRKRHAKLKEEEEEKSFLHYSGDSKIEYFSTMNIDYDWNSKFIQLAHSKRKPFQNFMTWRNFNWYATA